jgi:hypothetical protein
MPIRLPAPGAAVFVATAIAVSMLAGCGDDEPEPQSGPGPRPGKVPPGVTLSNVCDGAFYPQGAAYEGAAPHPIRVVPQGRPYTWSSPVTGGHPWDDWDRADAHRIQLVACEQPDTPRPTGKSCTMQEQLAVPGSDVKTMPTQADPAVLRLIEVRTGKTVGEVTVEPFLTCPATYQLRPGEVAIILRPNTNQIQAALTPYANTVIPTPPTPSTPSTT